MLGLLEPTRGEVLIDGVPLSVLGARAYREQVGAVMQEDQLLSGSVADNICFFDPSFDQQRMVQCASLARIHDEILSMIPLGRDRRNFPRTWLRSICATPRPAEMSD